MLPGDIDPLLAQAWTIIESSSEWDRATLSGTPEYARRSKWIGAAGRWREQYHLRLRYAQETPAATKLAMDNRQLALECASRLGGHQAGTSSFTVIKDAEAFLRWLEHP